MKKHTSRLIAVVGTFICLLAWTPRVNADAYTMQIFGGSNTAEDGKGNSISIGGGAAFDEEQGIIHGGGTYTEFNSRGKAVQHGSWRAVQFLDFCSFGGPSNNFQGGVLDLIAEILPARGGAPRLEKMTVTCRVFEEFAPCLPPDPPNAAAFEEGVIIGEFTKSTSGVTLYALHGQGGS